MDPKQRAAEAALTELRDDQIVGLGTGSTADFFLRALAEAIRAGKLKNIRGVPTSKQSEQRARELGIPLTSFDQISKIDITVDGADEIAPGLQLIKGLGGALLREKIVAQNSHRLVIIADASKVVSTLGTKGALPVEVLKFGHETQPDFLRKLGCTPTLRLNESNQPFVTDSGNYIFHCRFPRIDNPDALESSLKKRGGIIETGLFLHIAKLAFIATADSVERRER